jgi:hypothetical protein
MGRRKDMPPRNPELPEGTDHIVNGAMETGAGTSASTGSSGGAGRDESGFIATGGGDGTGGTAMGSGSGGAIRDQVRDSVQSLRGQATDRARSFAVEGKDRATSALEEFAQVMTEAAGSVDERLGPQYGEYARKAADAITGYADTLRNKDVDALYEDVRNVVRKSPAMAIGAAAVVGFAIARLIKSGLEENDVEVEFTPDQTTSSGSAPRIGTGGASVTGDTTGTSGRGD